MSDYKRVREGGWEYSIPARLVTEGVEVLDKPATQPSGKPIPPKPITALGTPAPGSKQEKARTQTTGETVSGKDAGQTSATKKGN